jgi:hypothetical protein
MKLCQNIALTSRATSRCLSSEIPRSVIFAMPFNPPNPSTRSSKALSHNSVESMQSIRRLWSLSNKHLQRNSTSISLTTKSSITSGGSLYVHVHLQEENQLHHRHDNTLHKLFSHEIGTKRKQKLAYLKNIIADLKTSPEATMLSTTQIDVSTSRHDDVEDSDNEIDFENNDYH